MGREWGSEHFWHELLLLTMIAFLLKQKFWGVNCVSSGWKKENWWWELQAEKMWEKDTGVYFRGNKAACTRHPYLCSSACAFTFPDFQQRSSIHWKAFETSLCSLNIKFIQISDVTDYLPKIRKNLHHHWSSNSELSLWFLFIVFFFLPTFSSKIIDHFLAIFEVLGSSWYGMLKYPKEANKEENK